MNPDPKIAKEAASRIAAEIEREKAAARAAARREIPSARKSAANARALRKQCEADLQGAARARDDAEVALRVLKRDAANMSPEAATATYTEAKQNLRVATDRVEIMRERLDNAISACDYAESRIPTLEADARGYSAATMKIAESWLTNSDLDRLERSAHLDRGAVDVLRKIAAGEEVANGAAELARVTTAITDAEGSL